MKKLLLISVAIILVSATAFGQKTKVKAVKKPLAKKAAVFTREKFDPKRDPKLDLATAILTASKSGKRIILDVGGEWCGWCIHMDKFLFSNKALDKLRKNNFVWIKINMSPENENLAFLSEYPEIKGYPHLFVLDESGTLLHSQDTVALEKDETYNLAKFTEFLKLWSPKK
ncbi:MAG TPA: thioredoxin family protein [Pyrinomonadaceae bacterium]|nr:thioredoxin family protein [Pyrinomonadaceae bacterium]